MKNILLLSLLLAVLSPNASGQQINEKKREATRAIFAQLVHPITPPAEMRSFLSRVGPIRKMYYETEVLDENSEVPGEFTFRIRERHRVAGKKPHPRDGLIVHMGYYEAHSGKVYILDRQAAKYVPAAKHPKVIEGKKKQAEHNRLLLREMEKQGLSVKLK